MRCANFWKSFLSLLFLLAGMRMFAQQTYTIRHIEITGTEKTKPQVILRELTFSEGDVLDSAGLENARLASEDNVYNLGLFNQVTITLHTSADSAVYFISVKERWYIIPIPYLSLEERTFNEWWADKDLDRLVYGLGAQWNNFTGWNDMLYVYAQGGYSRRVTLLFNRPFLFRKARVDGQFGFRYLNNKEIGYGTVDGVLQLARLHDKPMRKTYSLFATLSKRFSPRKFVHFTADYQYFQPHDSIVYFNDRYLTNASGPEHYPSVALSYTRDQRDLRTFPMDGWRFSASVRQSGLPGIGTTSFTKFSLTFARHFPLSRRWNFAAGTENGLALGDRIPYFDKFFIGFRSFVRGYERYVVDGSAYTIAKTEIKFAVIPRRIVHLKYIPFRKFQDFPLGIYLSAFTDGGVMFDNTFNNTDTYLKNQPLVGYGVGLNCITMYDFLIRLEYSRNQFGQTGIFISSVLPIK